MTDDHRHPGAVRTLVLPGAAHAVLAAVIAIPVYWRLFQFRALYDDEGYRSPHAVPAPDRPSSAAG